MGDGGYGISPAVLDLVAGEIADTARRGVELAVVVGGGNIFRGVSESAKGMDRASADYVGMLGTGMNAVSLQEAVERAGVVTRVLSAIEMQTRPFSRWRIARRRMYGSHSCCISMADSTRVTTPARSTASCSDTAFITVASMPT